MRIDGKDHRVNVQILCMEHEAAVVRMAIDSLLPQLDDGVSLSVLVNGGRLPELERDLAPFEHVRYYECPRNLGVAGGRNVLLDTPEAEAADLILFVDNDAIASSDYVRRLATFLVREPEAGVVGAVSVNYRFVESRLLARVPPQPGFLCPELALPESEAVLDLLRADPDRRALHHLGTNHDWRSAYLKGRDFVEEILVALGLQARKRFHGMNSEDPELVGEALTGGASRLEVANVAGCTQAFRRDLVERIGRLNELFNLYGYEDVDFCLRARDAGFRNYVALDTCLLHGTDRRHATRVSGGNRHRFVANQSRARTILEYLRAPEAFPTRSLERLALQHLRGRVLGTRTEHSDLLAGLQGFRTALDQLACAFGEEIREALARARVEPAGIGDGFEASLVRRLVWRTGGAGPGGGPATDAASRTPRRLAVLRRERERDRATRGEAPPPEETGPAVRPSAGQARFASLGRFRDRHRGERCFIIGNGPSLKQTDLSWLTGEISIGVNGFFYMTDVTGFAPTYYVVEDNHVVADNLARIRSYACTAKFFPDRYAPLVGDLPNTYLLPTDWSFYWGNNEFFEVPQFSRDLTEIAYVGQTVTYLNIQLAWYMGFREVYLIGVDFSYRIPKEAEIDGLTIISTDDDPNHFHPAYFGRGKKWHFPKLHNCLKAYRHAREVFESSGREIYNATVGGQLEVFERTDYQALFDDTGRLEEPNAGSTFQLSRLTRELAGRTTGNERAFRLLIAPSEQETRARDHGFIYRRHAERLGVALEVDLLEGTGPRPAGGDGGRPRAGARPDDGSYELAHVDVEHLARVGSPHLLASALEAGRLGFVCGLRCGLAGTDDGTASVVEALLRWCLSRRQPIWVFGEVALIVPDDGLDLQGRLRPSAVAGARELVEADLEHALEIVAAESTARGIFLSVDRPAIASEDWAGLELERWRASPLARLLAALHEASRPALLGAGWVCFEVGVAG